MKKHLPEAIVVAAVMAVMTGCAADDAALRTALNKDTEAVSLLAREQAKLVASKGAPADVYGKVAQTEPYLKEMRKLCAKPEKEGAAPAQSCIFYRGLGSKFVAEMLLTSGRYYLKNDDRAKSGEILRDLVDTYTDAAYSTEASQAKALLENIGKWDTLSTGIKAFVLGDYETALRELSTKDDPESLYDVGLMHYMGSGTKRDAKQAAEWYRKAADKGYAPAQYQLGVLYAAGDGVDQDDKEAAAWLQKAVDQDYAPAREPLRILKTK